MDSDSDEKMRSHDVALPSSESAAERRREYPRKHAVSESSEILGSEGSRKIYFVVSKMMISQIRVQRLLAAALASVLLFCVAVSVSAQQTNPNNLPPCPEPTRESNSTKENYSKWNNCFGKRGIVLYLTVYNYTHDDTGKSAIYEGNYLEGIPNGWGEIKFGNGGRYVGEFRDGYYHGQGIRITADGRRFEGIWENSNFIREAKVNLPNLNNNIATNTDRTDLKGERQQLAEQVNPYKLPPCPKPDFSKNYDIGVGGRTEKWTNCWGRYKVELSEDYKGDVFEGEWRNGLMHGQGTYYSLAENQFKGDKYVGEFKDGKRDGQGTYYYLADNQFKGDKYVGEYKDGKIHGQGTYTHASGEKYVGELKDGKRYGLGIGITADGRKFEGIWENDYFIREAKVNLPNLNNNIATNSDRNDIERERQQLAEERRKLEQEKREREQQRNSQRVNLQVTHTQPAADGSFIINLQTNADTASLLINGEEQGGRADGRYTIKRVARVGQDTQFKITAIDIYGNSDSKIITVARQSASAADTFSALKPEVIKRAPSRDAVAIIIGIQDYKRVPKAEFANNDAKEFYEYAIRALGIKPEKIKMLLDDEADEVNIVKAFENWLPIQVNRDKTDIYVFFSGHGLPAPDGKSLYFLPQGVDKELLSRTAVSQNDIVAALSAAKPKSVTMFIDACYSGQTRGGDILVANAKPVSLKSETNDYPPNFTVITASANDQISSSSPELKHGIFSFYLMKGMEGEADANKDGKITVGEMQYYLSDKVARQAMTLNRKQTTQLVGDAGQVLVGK
jgi:hypothetical protein